MTTLTEALERIMNWLREHQPDYAASFLPGLKYDEIQAAEAELGFKLPSEIYELYQWRNGSEKDPPALCYPTMQFLPFSEAIEVTKGYNENYLSSTLLLIEENTIPLEEIKWYETIPLFIFIGDYGEFAGIPIVDYKIEKLPVIDVGKGDPPNIFYASLTEMILTLAECYETNAYYLNEDGYIEEDECKVAEIFRKYNGDIPRLYHR